MDISVVGTGYVGLVAGVCFADVGHKVVCVDNNPEKIEGLQAGKIPIYEPGLEDLLKSAKDRISFTMDLEAAVNSTDVVFIAVGTPEKEDGSADLGPTFAVVDAICDVAKSEKVIVLKSTVAVGTNQKVAERIRAKTDVPHEIVNNPEFLKEGAAIDDFLRPDRVVIGCASEKAKSIMGELYRPFTQQGQPILFMSNTAAELTKYAANAFLSVKISFANELAALADKVGADINEVRAGFTSDARICESFFYPGVGYGGSCFPKDVQALIHTAKENGVGMDIVESADSVNDDQKTVLFDKVSDHFGDLKDKKIAMWGLAFKPRTDDVREAPAKYLLEKLVHAGAHVVAYDPVATETAKASFPTNFETAPSAMDACKDADALLLVTEWNEFKNPDYSTLKSQMKTPLIFDGRNALNISEVKSNGFDYVCMGRQSVFRGLS